MFQAFFIYIYTHTYLYIYTHLSQRLEAKPFFLILEWSDSVIKYFSWVISLHYQFSCDDGPLELYTVEGKPWDLFSFKNKAPEQAARGCD